MSTTDKISTIVDENATDFIELSDSIWNHPQLRWNEFDAVEKQIALAEKSGFSVTRDVAGIPTAFAAERGAGGPVIAFLGEYDALAGLSQASGELTQIQDPANTTGHGHGCGHHLLGAGALLAATATAEYLSRNGLPGRVRYYGCPAEEAAAGKSFMVRDGAFADVDAAVTWHPFSSTWSGQWLSLAYTQAYFHFRGVPAHAGMSPEMGRSALDAVELMNVGINFLREHMSDSSRIHYAITDAGGPSPNVVQAEASAYYCVRALTLPAMRDLYERVVKVARGAAMMTETELSIEFDGACAEYVPNTVLEAALYSNVQSLGPIPFTADDQLQASKFLELNAESEIALTRERSGIPPTDGRALHAGPAPLRRVQLTGSTDVGDVSWVTPTVQLMGTCMAIGTTPHTWQWVAQGKLPAAHTGMVYSAKAIAATAVDLFVEPELLAAAREEFTERSLRNPYVSPIPDTVVAPPLRGPLTQQIELSAV